MTTTETTTNTSTIEDLDFAPRCSVKRQLITGRIEECENEAQWVADCPGCDGPTLFCEDHRGGVREFQCTSTGSRHTYLKNWRRI